MGIKLKLPVITTWVVLAITLANMDSMKAATEFDRRRPLVAIWGGTIVGEGNEGVAPFLRIALWEDGRVVFAPDPTKWDRKLLEGRISANRVAEVKKRLAETGVFDLKERSYRIPDSGADYILVNFGQRQQMLCWDEVEDASYGFNFRPTPEYRRLKVCWKAINRLMFAIRPQNAKPIKEGVGIVQNDWYLKLP